MNKLLTHIKFFISKEYWKSNPQIESNVSIWRRLLAFIFDSFIGASMLISFYLLISPLINSDDLRFILLIILFCLYIFIDYWFLPNKTGFTISRWICGYQILEANDQLPRITSLFRRGVALWLINLLTIDLASLLPILFRKDNRAIHDIFSNTKTKRSVKYPFYLRLSVITFFIVFSVLGGIKIGLRAFSSTFIIPQLEYAAEERLKEEYTHFLHIPNENIGEMLVLDNSNFFILNGNRQISKSDSGIIIDSVAVKVKANKDRMSFSKDTDLFSKLPLSKILISFFSQWNTEELYRMSREDDNIKKLKNAPLLKPIENIKRNFASFFTATTTPYFKNAIQKGLISNPTVGNYAWVRSNKYNVVTFDLFTGDTLNSVLFVLPVNEEKVAKFLLNNTGIVANN